MTAVLVVITAVVLLLPLAAGAQPASKPPAGDDRTWAVGGFLGATTLLVAEGGGWDPTAPTGSVGFEMSLGERWSLVGEATFSAGYDAAFLRHNYFLIGGGKLRWALAASERRAPYVTFGIAYLYDNDTFPSGRTRGDGGLAFPVGVGYSLDIGQRWSIRPEAELYLAGFGGGFLARYGVGVWYGF
jgi:hypothetical protein